MFDKQTFDRVGPHEVAVVGDVVYVRWHGSQTVEDMEVFAEHVRKRIPDQPWVLQVMDFGDIDDIPAKTRKKIGEITKAIPYRGFVMLNASFKMEVIGKLVMGAIAIISKVDAPLAFVKSEAEADAWLEKRRVELRGAAVGR